MITAKFFQEFTKQFSEILPSRFQNFGSELEQPIRHALEKVLNKFDLVSREEFETQKQVLNRLQEKVTQLEIRIATLETMVDQTTLNTTQTQTQAPQEKDDTV